MSQKTGKASAPTDLELMLYADGELDPERREAVALYLAESRAAQRKLAAMGLVSTVVREQAAASASKADGIADLVMAAIEAERAHDAASAPARPPKVVPLRPRLVFAFAAVVVAAAAAIALWIGAPPQPERMARLDGVRGTASTSSGATHAASSAPDAARGEGDSEHGVVVSAVDFGARLGAIFYVPTDSATSTTTTVVWLADDPAEGDE
jgi:anti-sigma factor RsiW